MNRGRAGFDRTHMYVQSYIYDLPVGTGKRWLSSGPASWILGGWQFAGVFSGYTGTPMTFGYSATTLNAPGNGQRANMTALPNVLHNVGPGQKWFEVGAFSVPATATFGNGGRNVLSGPGLINLDMSIFKKFPITERSTLEIRMESFNFTNTPHFNNPGSTLGGTGFGEVTGAFGERQFQFGLKITF